MANSFGKDILIQAENPQKAAQFYTSVLGFAVTDPNPRMIALGGPHINLFIEQGPKLGPVMEVTVKNLDAVKQRLLEHGCTIVKDEPHVPRCYMRDPFGLIYNLRQ